MIPFLFTIGLCSFSGFLLLLYLTTPHKSMPIRHLRALHLFFGKEAIFLKCHCFGYNSSISSSSCEPIAYVQICANSYYHLQTRCFLTDIEKQKDPGVVSLGFIVEHMMSRELPQSGVPSIFEPFALKQKIKQYPPAHNEPMGCLCDLYLPRFRTDNSLLSGLYPNIKSVQ